MAFIGTDPPIMTSVAQRVVLYIKEALMESQWNNLQISTVFCPSEVVTGTIGKKKRKSRVWNETEK